MKEWMYRVKKTFTTRAWVTFKEWEIQLLTKNDIDWNESHTNTTFL